ncbi:MAG: helix-turn-helix transcriptional regulator [Anaerolineaceae bacterium]|nr:helix-turn-helix transcriptional regulator [Anaerolineaceae bacterium]MBN2677285.1 helix-turn-helix transcriptional regulator [Anaerolineaceae bacterium]
MNDLIALNQISVLLKIISHPSRLAILLSIGEGETCVCHLETMLGWSQSHISQQLMILRKAGIVSTRRENRFIHYRLVDPALLDLIRKAAHLKEVVLPVLQPTAKCECSSCCKYK